ncbi:hypothetical protein GN316_18005 [Xylophilus sp. Kf1]|nr:hypothetical protein [Xylophilus sp. Kf1]
MSFDASNALSLPFGRGVANRAERQADAVVPMYTPMWYATKVMATTANSWWEGGVPPSRRRGQRAADAVVHAAAGVARRLHVVRG